MSDAPMPPPVHRYALALGGNRRTRWGSPAATLSAAVRTLRATGVAVTSVSPIIATAAMGPAGRGFANAAAIVTSPLAPPALLLLLKQVERHYGRRAGKRWGPRPLDLDILLWSGGTWPPARAPVRAGRLQVPHAALAQRRFVLDPLVRIAPDWRLPRSARTIRQLHARAKG